MAHTRLERLVLRIVAAVVLAGCLVYGWWYYANHLRNSRNIALYNAVAAGDAGRVESLLKEGADPNSDAPIREGMSFRGELARGLVDRAILEGHSDVAVSLLKHGGKLNLGRMMEIAALPDTRVLEYEIAAKGKHSDMFMYACMAGNEVQAKYLVERYPYLKMSLKGEALANMRLSQAAKKGNIRIVKTLIENGADKNFRGYEYLTPIMHAAQNGHKEIVALLLTYDPDLEYKDFRGETALSYAQKGGNPAIVDLLTTAERHHLNDRAANVN